MDQELVQYLDERFGRVEQQLNGHDRQFDSITQRFDGVEQRLDWVEHRIDRVDQRLDGHSLRFDEVKRHMGVLVEGLQSKLQVVAEGLLIHIDVRHRQRVENLERPKPN